MRATLDRFGRIVVPKDIRDRLGLKPGAEVELDEQGAEIILKPAERTTPLRVEQGVLVFGGTALGDLDDAVKAHRNERIRHLSPRKRG
jgi:AbrB family looped-hinge helix DNA binding protein